jgi:hypothetical protein
MFLMWFIKILCVLMSLMWFIKILCVLMSLMWFKISYVFLCPLCGLK